jgi:hypothetical protein
MTAQLDSGDYAKRLDAHFPPTRFTRAGATVFNTTADACTAAGDAAPQSATADAKRPPTWADVRAQQADRQRRAMQAAWQNGYDTGERVHYMQGWRWGVLCGVPLGMVLVPIFITLGGLWARLPWAW